NTVRVFSRWIGYRGDVKSKHGQERLWSVAQSILPRRSVRDRTRGPASINQAAMELGALICTPKAPACDRCPVVKHCAAHEHGLESEIPGKVSRIEIEIRTEFALILRQRDRLDGSDSSRILVRQIPDGQRFAGMLDVPRIGSPEANNASAAVAWLANELGHAPQGWCVGTRHQTIKHGVTKYRITLHVHEVMVESTSTLDDAPPAPWRWMPIDELATRPINVTTRRIVKMLADEAQPLLPS
ncbi:MAG: NUDIX domain-containing protein, partial [Planctomycetota bacterium]